MSNFKFDARTIGIIVLLIVAAVIFLPSLLGGGGLFGGGQPAADPIENQPTVNPRDTTLNTEDGIELGRVLTAANIDRDQCAVDPTTTFPSGTETVYVIAENSDIAAGTEVFVRWYLDDQVYEESNVITADQDYEDTCVNFSLSASEIQQLRSGRYEAEFIINGNPADTVAFEVR